MYKSQKFVNRRQHFKTAQQYTCKDWTLTKFWFKSMFVTLSIGLKLHIPKYYIVQANDIFKKNTNDFETTRQYTCKD